MKPAHLPRFGRTRIETLESGLYQPSDDGAWAVILEVSDCFSEIEDSVAWYPNDPGHWWLRYGGETAVLGAPALAFSSDREELITLFSTPDEWLMAHGRYLQECTHFIYPIACILDWGATLEPLFHGIPRVDCNNPELQKQLQRSFREWEPQIYTTEQGIRSAA